MADPLDELVAACSAAPSFGRNGRSLVLATALGEGSDSEEEEAQQQQREQQQQRGGRAAAAAGALERRRRPRFCLLPARSHWCTPLPHQPLPTPPPPPWPPDPSAAQLRRGPEYLAALPPKERPLVAYLPRAKLPRVIRHAGSGVCPLAGTHVCWEVWEGCGHPQSPHPTPTHHHPPTHFHPPNRHPPPPTPPTHPTQEHHPRQAGRGAPGACRTARPSSRRRSSSRSSSGISGSRWCVSRRRGGHWGQGWRGGGGGWCCALPRRGCCRLGVEAPCFRNRAGSGAGPVPPLRHHPGVHVRA